MPGPWCYHIPLAANPLLRGGVGPLSGPDAVGDFPERRPRGLHLFFVLHEGGVTTLGRLAAALPFVVDGSLVGPQALLPEWLWPLRHALLFSHFYSYATNRYYRDGVDTLPSFRQDLDRLLALVRQADPGWLGAAVAAAAAAEGGPWVGPQGPGCGPRDALGRVLDCVCYQDPFALRRGALLPIRGLTVCAATRLLAPRPPATARHARQVAFCRLATGIPPERDLGTMDGLVHAMLRGMWRLKWDNKRKEVLWRLVHDALPLGARMGNAFRCHCGHPGPHDRLHAFWSCPVAFAVRSELLRALPGDEAARLRGLAHPAWLWMAGASRAMGPRGVLTTVWRVACLAALNAMDHGRAVLAALDRRPEGIPADAMALVAQLSAQGRFWLELQDYASLGLMHRRDLDRLGPDHPFLCRPEGERRCRVNRPAHVAPPEDDREPEVDPEGGFLVHPQ